MEGQQSRDPEKNVGRYSRKDKKRIDVNCSASVFYYNQTIGDVDQSDANIARCRTAIRGKKWYNPIFLYLLNLPVSNAWIVFRAFCRSQKSMTIASFCSEIASNLLSLHPGLYDRERKMIAIIF